MLMLEFQVTVIKKVGGTGLARVGNHIGKCDCPFCTPVFSSPARIHDRVLTASGNLQTEVEAVTEAGGKSRLQGIPCPKSAAAVLVLE